MIASIDVDSCNPNTFEQIFNFYTFDFYTFKNHTFESV